MLGNPIQFAVVREDPEIEASIVKHSAAQRALLIASGGCTALSLQALYPKLEITLLDFNPAQLGLIQRKMAALRDLHGEERKRAFNIGDASPSGLNACGNFESLFRQLRLFINEFVAPAERIASAFEMSDLLTLLNEVRSNKYWPVAFELFFSDAVLNSMFGPDATQHAPKGSYPGYFRTALERELARPRAATNPFLQHILLGHYLFQPESLPTYLQLPLPEFRFEMIEGTLERVSDLSRFDVIAFSNIFDWMPKSAISQIAERVRKETLSGTVVIYRQLNHSTDFQNLFQPEFQFDPAREQELLDSERSFFYSKLNIGTRR